jgi:hypothetical protein
LAAIVRKELIDEQVFDHCVLSLPDSVAQTEPLYVDANGVATCNDLLDYWRDREGMSAPILEDPVSGIRLISHLEEESWSRWLAERLTTRFGKPERQNLLRTLGQAPFTTPAIRPPRTWQSTVGRQDQNSTRPLQDPLGRAGIPQS